MIKIDYEKTNADGSIIFRDALYLPDDHTYTDADLDTMKQTRFDNWYAAVTAIPEPIIDTNNEQV